MMKSILGTWWCILAAVAIGMMPMAAAAAQPDYPKKPIQIIVGVAPGGLIDVSIRITAQYLSPRLGQPIVVENRPGANTTIGANAVLQATPDGYSFFYGGANSASPILTKNRPVNFVTQMKPVSMILSAPFFLCVNSNVPAKTLEELVAYSKQHPGVLNYADVTPHATMVMHSIAERTGLNFTPIPYKGSGPALTALIANEIQLTLDTVPNYMPHIQAGKVRTVMSTGLKRTKSLPDVPTGVELKVIDFETGSVFGLWAPAGTPDAIIQRINREIGAVAKDPAYLEKFRAASQVDPVASTPAELLKFTESDYAFLSKVAKKIGFQPQ
jgi:tripartite-type tricarboxylate transporter receptor subunit TctC